MPTSLVTLAALMDSIRGFVAVGRRMSITQAAADLCLTQSAVSRQVQALEERLGVRLLVRGHRSIAFTPEGEHLFRAADGAVRQLQDAVDAISTRRGRRPVTVTASIGVTGLWLLPRLGRFQTDHPGIDVRISANNRIVDLATEGVDLAIRYGPSSSVPDGSVRLFGDTVAPVAHPSQTEASLATAAALEQQVLLEFDDPHRPWLHWNDWLAALGWSQRKPRAVLRFNQYDQVVQSALAGQGIALGRLELIGDLLADGRLRIVDTPARHPPSDFAYWLVEGEPTPRADVVAVADWIRAEAAAMPPPDRALDA